MDNNNNKNKACAGGFLQAVAVVLGILEIIAVILIAIVYHNGGRGDASIVLAIIIGGFLSVAMTSGFLYVFGEMAANIEYMEEKLTSFESQITNINTTTAAQLSEISNALTKTIPASLDLIYQNMPQVAPQPANGASPAPHPNQRSQFAAETPSPNAPAQIQCPRCGAYNKANQGACHACGEPLSASKTQPPAAPNPDDMTAPYEPRRSHRRRTPEQHT